MPANIETTTPTTSEQYDEATAAISDFIRALEADMAEQTEQNEAQPGWEADLDAYKQALDEMKKFEFLGEVTYDETSKAIDMIKSRLASETNEQAVEELQTYLQALETSLEDGDIEEFDYDQIAQDYFFLAQGLKNPDNGEIASQRELPTVRRELLIAIERMKSDAKACTIIAASRQVK